jgi:hypothetical protein
MKKFLLFALLLFLATTGYRAQAQGRIIEFSHPKMKVSPAQRTGEQEGVGGLPGRRLYAFGYQP